MEETYNVIQNRYGTLMDGADWLGWNMFTRSSKIICIYIQVNIHVTIAGMSLCICHMSDIDKDILGIL